jgi:hypothetical protein
MEWMRSRRATWWQDWRICRATDSYSPSSAALRSTCGGGSGSIGTCRTHARNHQPIAPFFQQVVMCSGELDPAA